jgi:predicted PurR-regulated permease PerM
MIKNLYLKIPRRMRILIIFLLIVAAVGLIVKTFTPETKNTPKEFLETRQEASLIAKDIIDISSRTAENIKKISDLDKNKEYTEALNLISEELNNNRLARENAISLSAKLEIMAKNVSQISPAAAGQIAIQAISSETTLISRLITYNDYLIKLLEILQAKFLEKEKNANDKIADLIEKINDEARAINDLNNNFNNLMTEFDKSR